MAKAQTGTSKPITGLRVGTSSARNSVSTGFKGKTGGTIAPRGFKAVGATGPNRPQIGRSAKG